jgi:tetratricopeptide (TPR) repeat protein
MAVENEEEARGMNWSSQTIERRIALENEIHQIISKYLDGEEVPQNREDFARGIDACIEARKLAGGSLFLEGREEFFRGRTLIFDKNYSAAADHLYRSIRLDPASPYAYNALGISFLEQARYDLATAAFSDAISRAPYWAYPRHNLALTRMQVGEYTQAIANYREAIDLVPRYSYLPYNLGLVYQRMNLVEDAEAAYLQARSKAPWRALPSIALGVLMTERGREGRARRYFEEARQALDRNPDPASRVLLRHNEAVLLAHRASTIAQAQDLWRENIASADYLPSRFALAHSLSESVNRKRLETGALQAAGAAWQDVLRQVPNHTGARIEYAGFLERTKRRDDAIRVLLDGLQISPGDVRLKHALEQLQKR